MNHSPKQSSKNIGRKPKSTETSGRLLPTPNTMEGLDPKPLERIVAHNAKARPGRSYLSMNLREEIAYGPRNLDGSISSPAASPCQPFSQAGRRKGTDDHRYLWPEMLRVIREFKPQRVIGENVAGLLTWNDGLVLETVCTDLEAEGYEVQPFIIPAVAVNAPHRRDRVWIVACHTDSNGRTGGNEKIDATKGRQSPLDNLTGRHSENSDDASDASDKGLERNERELKTKGCDRQFSGEGSDEGGSWNENWLEVATRLCTLDDGLPNGLVRPKGWRNAALKGAGNAWVPQVAIEIMKAIKEINQ